MTERGGGRGIYSARRWAEDLQNIANGFTKPLKGYNSPLSVLFALVEAAGLFGAFVSKGGTVLPILFASSTLLLKTGPPASFRP